MESEEFYTYFDIYKTFRIEQSNFLSRPYKLPKDFDIFLEKRFSKPNREKLKQITNYFNTKWSKIDINKYFQYGFELFGKSFSYNKFLDERLIKYYISKDKNEKRQTLINKKKIEDSILFMNKWFKENIKSKNKNTSWLVYYINKKYQKESIIIHHYVKGYIDKITLVWLIYNNYFLLQDHEKYLIPHVIDNYRDLIEEMLKVDKWIKEKIKNYE